MLARFRDEESLAIILQLNQTNTQIGEPISQFALRTKTRLSTTTTLYLLNSILMAD